MIIGLSVAAGIVFVIIIGFIYCKICKQPTQSTQENQMAAIGAHSISAPPQPYAPGHENGAYANPSFSAQPVEPPPSYEDVVKVAKV